MTPLVLLFVGAFCFAEVACQSACPAGWQNQGQSCYFLHYHDRHTWTEAKEFCDTHGAHLAFVQDAAENSFIKGLIGAHLSSDESDDNVWLGATDEIVQGQFYWYQYHDIPEALMTFTDWEATEPNFSEVEDCVVAWADYGWQWANLDCGDEAFFVCEKPYVHI